MNYRGNINNKLSTRDYVEEKEISLKNEIEKYKTFDNIDLSLLTEQLEAKYRIEPITLKKAIPSEPIETKREVPYPVLDRLGKKIYKIGVELPFEGETDLFHLYPNSSTTIFLTPAPEIKNSSIKFYILLNELDAEKFNSEMNKYVAQVETNLPAINSEITSWNSRLELFIINQLKLKSEKLQLKKDFMQKIGLDINPASTEYMVPSSIKKKVIPKPVSETSKGVAKGIIPYLENEVYKDIKEVIYNVGRAIERKPSLYKSKKEEDLRDNFLLFLETRYESTNGTGETFNKNGKTDILLKLVPDGSNIFIAECKFWHGKKEFLEAINQLFGYVTHRDTKTALMLFVDQKNFQSVLTTIKDNIKGHPQYKSFVGDTYDTSFSYEFTHPHDEAKLIYLEIIVFHFYNGI